MGSRQVVHYRPYVAYDQRDVADLALQRYYRYYPTRSVIASPSSYLYYPTYPTTGYALSYADPLSYHYSWPSYYDYVYPGSYYMYV